MSSRATVLALVDTLTYNLADTTQTAIFFDEVIQELGHDPRAWLTTVAVQPTGTTNAVQALSTLIGIVRVLAVFYQNRQLRHATITELDAWNPAWRDERGRPVAYTTEEESDRTIRLYPQPTQTMPTGDLTTDPPLAFLYTEQRTTVPDWLDLPVALLVLARELQRESNHRDLDTATIARALAMDMLKMVA